MIDSQRCFLTFQTIFKPFYWVETVFFRIFRRKSNNSIKEILNEKTFFRLFFQNFFDENFFSRKWYDWITMIFFDISNHFQTILLGWNGIFSDIPWENLKNPCFSILFSINHLNCKNFHFHHINGKKFYFRLFFLKKLIISIV